MWNDITFKLRGTLCALAFTALAPLAQAATVQIINANEPGVGFNDATPAAPVGGNPGTTVGQQRLIAFRYAADIWARELRSAVPISVLATFEPLDCDADSAVLGAAGALSIFSDFPGAKKPGTWYPGALANKLAGADQDPGPYPDGSEADIVAFFNSDLGKPGCLEGSPYYLGLDGNIPPGQLDLISTLLHELGHGLGFQAFIGRSGARPAGLPTIWEYYMYDFQSRKTWLEMTDAERAASAISARNVGWNGERVRDHAERVLQRGSPELEIQGRFGKRDVMIAPAAFGAPLSRRGVNQALGKVVDQADGTGRACTALSAANITAVAGKIAIVDRGGCTFTTKALNVQGAGAVAMIVVDNVPGTPPRELAGADPLVFIPAVRVAQEDGPALKALAGTNAVARLGLDMRLLLGAGRGDRVLMYTPNPYEPGSSISHFDTLARRNLLMEPFDNPDQPQAVRAPYDLTLELLKDIGW
jgi:PA domain